MAGAAEAAAEAALGAQPGHTTFTLCSLSHSPPTVLTLTLPTVLTLHCFILTPCSPCTTHSHCAHPAPLTHTVLTLHCSLSYYPPIVLTLHHSLTLCSPSPRCRTSSSRVTRVYAGGLLSRSSFRAGHQGQCVRPVDTGSQLWWTRPLHDWSDDEQILAAGAVLIARARRKVSVIAQVDITDRQCWCIILILLTLTLLSLLLFLAAALTVSSDLLFVHFEAFFCLFDSLTDGSSDQVYLLRLNGIPSVFALTVLYPLSLCTGGSKLHLQRWSGTE